VRNLETSEFVAEYETMAVESPARSDIQIWQPTQDYLPCRSTSVEGCLQAALEQIEAGPSPRDEAGEHDREEGVGGPAASSDQESDLEPVPEIEHARLSRLLRFRRKRSRGDDASG
jgi:hypothetical protein